MARYYDKDELKGKLELEQIYDLIEVWGGEPEYTDFGITSQTICHNLPGEGSRKLYYYVNTKLFKCYTGCVDSTFDIFELCIKIMKNQRNLKWELYDAMDYIASYFGFQGKEYIDEVSNELKDWNVFKKHKIQIAEKKTISLKEYNSDILQRFSYPRIIPWEREGISNEVCKRNLIGYYPGGEQITIPHFNIDEKLIGIRGRFLSDIEANRYGKYRPLSIGRTLYTHPLSMNLYNLNNSKENIKKSKIAIVFESEKSCLMYQSYYSYENDISVACCGSSISSYQIDLLKSLGVNEIIIAFDRQFQEIGDEEFKRLKAKLIHFYNKFNNFIKVTAIFDKKMISPYKASPIDCGPEIFEILLSERIIPNG